MFACCMNTNELFDTVQDLAPHSLKLTNRSVEPSLALRQRSSDLELNRNFRCCMRQGLEFGLYVSCAAACHVVALRPSAPAPCAILHPTASQFDTSPPLAFAQPLVRSHDATAATHTPSERYRQATAQQSAPMCQQKLLMASIAWASAVGPNSSRNSPAQHCSKSTRIRGHIQGTHNSTQACYCNLHAVVCIWRPCEAL